VRPAIARPMRFEATVKAKGKYKFALLSVK
jgi:hypothetical protein